MIKESVSTVQNTDDYIKSLRHPRGFPLLPEGWKTEWSTFRNATDRMQLFAVTHLRPTARGLGGPRVALVVHGMGEHGGRYLHLAHYLGDAVDAVVCLDLPGHGRSEGLRGDIERFDSLIDDIAHTVKRVHEQFAKRFGTAEVHLIGHSLGGHLVIRTCLKNPGLPIATLTASAPFLGIKVKVPAVKKAAATLLSRVWGSLQMETGLSATLLSHDPEVVKAYEEDRLVHGKMTPRFFMGVQAAMADTLTHTAGIACPFLLQVPMQDEVVDSDRALDFFRGLDSRHKTLKTYPQLFHEIYNETEKSLVLGDLKSFIQAHSQSGASA